MTDYSEINREELERLEERLREEIEEELREEDDEKFEEELEKREEKIREELEERIRAEYDEKFEEELREELEKREAIMHEELEEEIRAEYEDWEPSNTANVRKLNPSMHDGEEKEEATISLYGLMESLEDFADGKHPEGVSKLEELTKVIEDLETASEIIGYTIEKARMLVEVATYYRNVIYEANSDRDISEMDNDYCAFKCMYLRILARYSFKFDMRYSNFNLWELALDAAEEISGIRRPCLYTND